MSTSDTRQNIRPSEIDILRVNCENGEVRELGTLRQAYFSTIALSASGVELAVVEREEGTDRLKVAAVPSLTRTTLADGAEERVYLSDPSFSPDGRSIVYSKQSRWRVLSLIENLR
jgi:Tol biopolymer transport system component